MDYQLICTFPPTSSLGMYNPIVYIHPLRSMDTISMIFGRPIKIHGCKNLMIHGRKPLSGKWPGQHILVIYFFFRFVELLKLHKLFNNGPIFHRVCGVHRNQWNINPAKTGAHWYVMGYTGTGVRGRRLLHRVFQRPFALLVFQHQSDTKIFVIWQNNNHYGH